MKNIIFFTIKDSYVKHLKSIFVSDFWKLFSDKNHYMKDTIKVSEKLDSKQTYDFVVNNSGYTYFKPHENGKLFDLFKEGEVSAEQAISDMIRAPYSSFEKIKNEDGVHLFAMYEDDIEAFRDDDLLFKKLSKLISSNKKDNKIIDGDIISARLFKENELPFTYLAYIPKDKALWIDVSNNLITFFGQKNIDYK